MLDLIPNPVARRLFLDRHALSEAPVGPASGQALHDLIERIGFVQVDSINTVARAHEMILWSRRQSFRPPALKRLLERDRSLWEHWTHDASILPTRLHGVWQHRFQRDAVRLETNWKRWFRDGYEAQFDSILNRAAKDGPVGASAVAIVATSRESASSASLPGASLVGARRSSIASDVTCTRVSVAGSSFAWKQVRHENGA